MIRALLLVARWIGLAHDRWRAQVRRRRSLSAEVDALHEAVARLRAENDLLRARLFRLDPHRRPHFRPWERLAILLHRVRYAMSVDATARAFVVTGQTVRNWIEEVEGGIARLVRSRRPVNALPDLVREIVAFLKREWPRWGTRRIAGLLASLGLRGSRTSVQRVLRRPPPGPPRRSRGGRLSPLRARGPGHVCVVDFTAVRGFFNSIVVGAVLDAWSRKVLALRAWPQEPDARAACLLVRDAIPRYGRPTWVLSDRGPQFSSIRFRTFLSRRGIGRRYAAVGDPNLARLDRFWRSMKEEFACGLFLFKPVPSVERELRSYARWHATARPHQGLGLRLPEHVHAGCRRRNTRRTDGAVTLEITWLDGDRRLPVFRLRPAA